MVTNNETLHDKHTTLMQDIMVCDNMIDPDGEEIMMAVWADGTECELSQVEEFTHMSDDYEVISEQKLLERQLKAMCDELGTLEEVMSLKWHVDCDCFYTDSHPGHPNHAQWLAS